MANRIAVILFNLGGPDNPEAVQPFLYNLFSDPAIIALPQPWRGIIARWIARRRAPLAREIYAKIGGRSPLLGETEAQARALARVLRMRGLDANCFVAMRYWHPLSAETVRAVHGFAADRLVLLPLYPQFSTTTTASSLADWREATAAAGIERPSGTICCYPTNAGFIAALADLVAAAFRPAAATGPPVRILFSAHGLPKRVIARGDPYAWQVGETVKCCIAALEGSGLSGIDHNVCYQSRVGPLEWTGPAIEDELRRAAADGVQALVVPIAFVSEHSETLVELDIDYRERARALGVPGYHRVPTVGTHPAFIAGLADLVLDCLSQDQPLGPAGGRRSCPEDRSCCPAGRMSSPHAWSKE